jgi:hypothetical protein
MDVVVPKAIVTEFDDILAEESPGRPQRSSVMM